MLEVIRKKVWVVLVMVVWVVLTLGWLERNVRVPHLIVTANNIMHLFQELSGLFFHIINNHPVRTVYFPYLFHSLEKSARVVHYHILYCRLLLSSNIIILYSEMNDHIDKSTNSSVADFRFKVVLLGDLGAGKTSLIQRYIGNGFKEGQSVHRIIY
jgi:hypothetical protein